MNHLKGEALNVGFDGGIKLEFHGAKVTSDREFLVHRNQKKALGLFDSVSTDFYDNRTGRNIQHNLLTLLCQSVYSRLAGYEEINDAKRLSIDPVTRVITGKKDNGRGTADMLHFKWRR